MDEFDKKHPFKVPENYFRELSGKISNKTLSQNNIFKWVKNPLYQWALSSVVIIIISVFVYRNTYFSNTTNFDNLLAEVPNEMLISYLLEDEYLDLYSDDYDYAAIADEILASELSKYDFESEVHILMYETDLYLNYEIFEDE